MRSRVFTALSVSLWTAWVPAALTLSNVSGEQMSYNPSLSSISGGPTAYTVVINVQGENGGLITTSSFRGWWGAQIDGLSGGETLNFDINNLGFSDRIVPVWSTSTDGTNFTPDARVPGSAPNASQQFTVTVPSGVTTLRIWKYFPYTLADRDAFLASLPAANSSGPVRFNGSIGNSTEGRPIPMIELSDGSDDTGKHRVWIHAAIHCTETTGCFIVEGLVDFLLNSGTVEAQSLMSHCIFDIVPVLNVDGNARGNYRASAPNPPTDPNGADMEARYNDNGLGQSDFAECQAVIDRITLCNGIPPAAPGPNPVEVLLNLHSTHGYTYPMHFQHVGNYLVDGTGVIPSVNALETLWISLFYGRSPDFTALGSVASSTLGARGYVEALMNDRYSANASYSGPAIMAITYEGSYYRGHTGVTWNTPDDYRENGRELALALLDLFALPAPATLTGFMAN